MRLCNFRVLAGLCLLLLLLGGCAELPLATTATTDYDHSYDFSHVRRIAIQPISRDSLATVTISDAQISRIDEALTAELQRRGFQVVEMNADADIFLAWQLVTQERALVSTADGSTQQAEQGTFFVNMIDPVMLRTVWRARFASRLRGNIDSPEAAQFRQEAAQVILADFPPTAEAH